MVKQKRHRQSFKEIRFPLKHKTTFLFKEENFPLWILFQIQLKTAEWLKRKLKFRAKRSSELTFYSVSWQKEHSSVSKQYEKKTVVSICGGTKKKSKLQYVNVAQKLKCLKAEKQTHKQTNKRTETLDFKIVGKVGSGMGKAIST